MPSRILFIIALSLTSFSVSATPPGNCLQPTGVEEQVAGLMAVVSASPSNEGCADPTKLRGICNAVYLNFDPPPGTEERFVYMYEQQISDAACVLPTDSEAVAARKIRSMWGRLENDYLTCDTGNFDVSRGSILKYSVKLRNWEFLMTATDTWGVNLNKIDPDDNRTLLDYVKKEMERTKTDPQYYGTLSMYYQILRQKGAKLRSEL